MLQKESLSKLTGTTLKILWSGYSWLGKPSTWPQRQMPSEINVILSIVKVHWTELIRPYYIWRDWKNSVTVTPRQTLNSLVHQLKAKHWTAFCKNGKKYTLGSRSRINSITLFNQNISKTVCIIKRENYSMLQECSQSLKQCKGDTSNSHWEKLW